MEDANLTKIQKQLCDILQDGISVCEKPFARIAEQLQVSTEQVIHEIRQLKASGIIRRFRANINHRTLGKASTLVTAHVPENEIEDVAKSVNSLSSVSHNYLRNHFYNLWFTLQAKDNKEIAAILSNLHKQFEIDFHSLPVIRTFKLKVRFKINNKQNNININGFLKPKEENVLLSNDEKYILSKLQKELDITEKPFSFLCTDTISKENALSITQNLIDKGVIRRIAAVIDYQKLGFTANVLFACQVTQDNIIQAGEILAGSELVSHCYERKVFDGWPYNLFAMMHSKSMDEIKNLMNEFTGKQKIKSYKLLETIKELKKEPVEHIFE